MCVTAFSTVGWGEFANHNALPATICWGSCLTPTYRAIAVLDYSDVGKSTLINTLLGEERQSTGRIREDDTKGRHTTTRRSLIALDSRGIILDTPGMREIQLADCKEGIAATFSSIEVVSEQCKFSD